MQYYWAGWESLLLPFRLDTAVFHRWIWLFSFAENTIYSNHFIKTIAAWLSFGINVPEWNSNSTKNFSGDYTITTLGQAAQDSPSLSRSRSSGIRLAFTPEVEGCFKGFERKINGWALGAPGVVLQHSFGRSESTVRQQCINTIWKCVPSCATVAAGSNRLALWRIVATLVLTQVESQKVFQVILCKFWGVILWERVTDKYRPKLHSLIGSNSNHLILFMMTQCGYIIIHLHKLAQSHNTIFANTA